MKKVLMTGGTGMLGVSLTEYAIGRGAEVTVLVRSGSGRLERIPRSDQVQVVCCDLEGLRDADSLLGEHYDVFYHLGWQGTTGKERNDAFLQERNVRYTLEAVKLAHRKGCSTFIGAGSQAEYGRADVPKLTPTTPVCPETGYGMAKLCAGQMSRLLCGQYAMRHIWFRILSVYGPCDNEGSMVMSGIRNMLAGQSPKYTKGEQLWDYLYCKDAAKALWLAAEREGRSAVYCLGSGQARPLREYILEIWRQMDMPGEPQLGALPYGENQVMHLCADITALREDLGFAPEYSFEEGIRETIEWCRGEMIDL